ncbi:MAG: sensor histidine kinase [Candidatus Dormibacteria bacterium]
MDHLDRLRPSSAQLNWMARLLLLPLTLALVATYQQPGSHFQLLVGLLGTASITWMAWLALRRWRDEAPGAGLVPLLLMTLIAFTSGMATMVDGPGWAANLTGVVAVEAGATHRARTAVGVALAGILGLAVGDLIHGGEAYGLFNRLPTVVYVAFYAAVLILLMLAGLSRGLRRQQVRQAHLLLAQQQESSRQRERSVALAERTRIAREIHDILAHSLADLSIQLQVADALLSDGADAAGALQRIRHAHRLAAEGMEETQRAIQALRSDAPPLPDALAAIVGADRRGGGATRLLVEGRARPLPVVTSLALLRTAQEALANAHKHATGLSVLLELDYGPGRVGLSVTDGAREVPPTSPAGPAAALVGVSGGYGLAGMHERLQLVGGSLVAGPVLGGWTVHAEVPG